MFNTMSAYLDSNKIKVFPCGGRAIKYDPLARLTTEQNLISIINRLVDMNSFIVTTHASNQEMNNSIEEYIFNIDGYLFTVPNGVGAKNIIETALSAFTSNSSNKLTEGTSYYLLTHIRKETYQGSNNDGVLMTYTQLSPTTETTPGDYENGILDANEKFNGLEFIITPKSTASNYSNTTTDKYLILFECKCIMEQNNKDGKYYLDTTDGNYKPIPSGYAGDKYSFVGRWYEYEDSKIKFKTTINGLQRSVTIDDGVLN